MNSFTRGDVTLRPKIKLALCGLDIPTITGVRIKINVTPERLLLSAIAPKTRMIVLFRRCVGFGVRIAVWFRRSLIKQKASGNKTLSINFLAKTVRGD